MTDRLCSVEGCERAADGSWGWCNMHYQRSLRGDVGEPETRRVVRPATCSVEGCTRKHHGLGMCRLHYRRFKERGSLDAAPFTVGGTKGRCDVDGCGSPSRCRNLCSLHYRRLLRYGDVTIEPRAYPTVCAMSGCDEPHKAKGLCIKHHSRLLRRGDPLRVNLPVWLRCNTCDHPQVDEIESRIIDDGEPYHFVGRLFDLNEESIKRHCLAHVDPVWQAERAAWWVRELEAIRGGFPAS